ncbi:MAG: hypothetical protein LBD87_01005 [Prevotellaceae bacterium]|jgi:hypothetical protein|nr:hypothetical protein [Prevotellaceae bacterium]
MNSGKKAEKNEQKENDNNEVKNLIIPTIIERLRADEKGDETLFFYIKKII